MCRGIQEVLEPGYLVTSVGPGTRMFETESNSHPALSFFI